MSTSTTEPGAGVYRTHPGDDSPDTGTCSFHPGHSAGVSAYPQLGNGAVCFHPGDDSPDTGTCSFDPVDDSRTPAVNLYHHPADDLAADLHLSLTGIDGRQLAVLVGSRP